MRAFFVSSNIWVGIAVLALSLLSFPRPWTVEFIYYALFLFFSTVATYSYMRWVKLIQVGDQGQPVSVGGLKSPAFILIYILVSAGLSLFCFWYIFDWDLVYALIPAVAISALYPLAFPNPNRQFSSLRSLPMLKLLLIAASWSWLTYGIPMLMMDVGWDFQVLGELFFRTLLVAGLTIPFDVRDLEYDAESMQTIPQIFGVSVALSLAETLLLSYQVWVILAYFLWHSSLALSLAWLIGLELGARLIRGVNQNRAEAYIGFWLEGIPIFVFILYLASYWALGNY